MLGTLWSRSETSGARLTAGLLPYNIFGGAKWAFSFGICVPTIRTDSDHVGFALEHFRQTMYVQLTLSSDNQETDSLRGAVMIDITDISTPLSS
jgi:hypothetical protein